MYLKTKESIIRDKYISINTDKFNMFAPASEFKSIALYGLDGPSTPNSLQIACKEREEGFWCHCESYDLALDVYLKIVNQFNNMDFIDITCGKNRIFLLRENITALTRTIEIDTNIIVLFYRFIIDPQQIPIHLSVKLAESKNDLTIEYEGVVRQISNTPRNAQISTPKANFNKSVFWNSKENFDTPTPKESKETKDIEKDWCFIN